VEKKTITSIIFPSFQAYQFLHLPRISLISSILQWSHNLVLKPDFYLNLISQAQLAEKYRPSSEYVSRLERGINAPSIQALNAMSIILKVEIQDLLDFSELNWEMEIQALVVLMQNQKGQSIRKEFKLAEIEDE